MSTSRTLRKWLPETVRHHTSILKSDSDLWYFARQRRTKHQFEIVAICIKTQQNITERIAKFSSIQSARISTNSTKAKATTLPPKTSRLGQTPETFNKIIQVKKHWHLGAMKGSNSIRWLIIYIRPSFKVSSVNNQMPPIYWWKDSPYPTPLY